MSKKQAGKKKEAASEDRQDETTAESGQTIEIKSDSVDSQEVEQERRQPAEDGAASGSEADAVAEAAAGTEGGTAEEGEAEPEEEAKPIDPVAALEDQVADLNDQLLRKQADFDNFRKRMFREREEAIRYANQRLLSDLVEIIDNFERAIKSSEESKDFESFHKGIELIEKQFLSLLESKWGLTRFESEGEEFDPEKHEAIAVEESTEIESQLVAEDYQKGYMLHDRVLRHAKVKVLQPASEETE